jgi:predicted DCC family thiol-disulfide oxidoreductase YuxK
MNAAVFPLTIYYDGACRLCDAEMTNLKLRNFDGKLAFVDISATGEAGLPAGVSWEMATSLIQAKRADGQIISGVEVFRRAYDAVGILWVTRLTKLPVIGHLADAVYPWIARNRRHFPSFVTKLLFEKAVRQAAEKAAARRCVDGSCTL